MSSIEARVVEDFAALESRKDEWNALVRRAQTSSVFQTFECHISWWKAFGADQRLLILLAESGGTLLGIAPLMVRERRLLGRTRRVVQFIGARSFDYADFIVDGDRPDALPVLLSALTERVPSFDLLYLRDLPGGSRTIAELGTYFQRRALRTDIRVLYPAPTRLFNDPVADRQLPNKKSLKRHYNFFHRSGRLEFKNCATALEVFEYLDAFFEQHIRRRAATDTPSLFLDERARMFFRELVHALAPQGWLLFSVVSFNEKPIAMHFGFHYGGRIIWYKPAFDIEYAKHSPGEVLIKCLLEYALQQKVAELDFTIGEEPFKYRFANHTRSNYAVRVYRRWIPYGIDRLMLVARRFIERMPALARIARKVLSRHRDQPWF